MADRAHAGGGVVDFQMPVAVPGEGADPIGFPNAQSLHGPHQPAGSPFGLGPVGAVNGAFMGAGYDRGAGVVPGTMLEDAGDQQVLRLH